MKLGKSREKSLRYAVDSHSPTLFSPFSMWNSFQVMRRLSAGIGLLNRADMFAAVDNTVRLPGYTRADAALYYSVTERIRFQANVENLVDSRYFVNADGNNNISPGSGRAVRVGLTARF